MSSVIRLSRFVKLATATAAASSLYVYRDQIRPYVQNISSKGQPSIETKDISSIQEPKLIENLPERVPYLLVGGGTASHSAMRSIRGHDAKAKVLIVANEPYGPYMRPSLSKELWFSERDMRKNLNFKWWNGKERSIFYEIDEFFIPIEKLEQRETGGVSMINNVHVTRLDPDEKIAYLQNGQTIKYDKCLLAPGGKPKTLPELEAAPDRVKDRIVYFRTAEDFLKLENIASNAKRIVIIGGGFLGSELACSLAINRKSKDTAPKDQVIYQIYPEPGNLDRVLPRHLSDYVSKKIEKEGANLIPNVEVRKVTLADDDSIAITLSNGDIIMADHIVCAVGLEPDVELARASGLEVDEKTGGYLVNSELEARSNVWVAGDASCFYDIKLGRRRVEHHDHAVNSGKLAGSNMAGGSKPYTHQSMFWSDLGTDISFEAVGIIDSSLQTVSIFADPKDLSESASDTAGSQEQSKDSEQKQPTVGIETTINQDTRKEEDKYQKGVVFYLKDNVIVGILLWNLFSRLTMARRILNEQKEYDDLNEVAKLFNFYLDD